MESTCILAARREAGRSPGLRPGAPASTAGFGPRTHAHKRSRAVFRDCFPSRGLTGNAGWLRIVFTWSRTPLHIPHPMFNHGVTPSVLEKPSARQAGCQVSRGRAQLLCSHDPGPLGRSGEKALDTAGRGGKAVAQTFLFRSPSSETASARRKAGRPAGVHPVSSDSQTGTQPSAATRRLWDQSFLRRRPHN